MDRGAWQATVHGVSRVGRDLATKERENTKFSLSYPKPALPQSRPSIPVAQARTPAVLDTSLSPSFSLQPRNKMAAEKGDPKNNQSEQGKNVEAEDQNNGPLLWPRGKK